MKPYLEEKEAVLAEAGSSMEGLSDEEAAVRLVRDGHNKLKEGEKESLIRKFLGELKDPMTIVLIIAAVVSAITALYAGESLTDTNHPRGRSGPGRYADPGGRGCCARGRPDCGMRVHEDAGSGPDR